MEPIQTKIDKTELKTVVFFSLTLNLDERKYA